MLWYYFKTEGQENRLADSSYQEENMATDPQDIQGLRQLPKEDRLMALYQNGIDFCRGRDFRGVLIVLDELDSMLDHSRAESNEWHKRLYEYCRRRAKEGGMGEIKAVFTALRNSFGEGIGTRQIVS